MLKGYYTIVTYMRSINNIVGWISTMVWRQNRKKVTNPAFGKKWYNDGETNFLLSPQDPRVEDLHWGRLIMVVKDS